MTSAGESTSGSPLSFSLMEQCRWNRSSIGCTQSFRSELLGGVILLLVFRNDLSGREYLWFAAFLFLDGTMSLESVFNWVYPILPNVFAPLTNSLGMIGRYAPLVGFIAAFTGVRLNRWMRGYQILLLGIPVLFGLSF